MARRFLRKAAGTIARGVLERFACPAFPASPGRLPCWPWSPRRLAAWCRWPPKTLPRGDTPSCPGARLSRARCWSSIGMIAPRFATPRSRRGWNLDHSRRLDQQQHVCVDADKRQQRLSDCGARARHVELGAARDGHRPGIRDHAIAAGVHRRRAGVSVGSRMAASSLGSAAWGCPDLEDGQGPRTRRRTPRLGRAPGSGSAAGRDLRSGRE